MSEPHDCQCAHMHIENRKRYEGVGHVVGEWWECRDCGTHFAPAAPPTDTRQAVDAARERVVSWTEFRGVSEACELYSRLDAFERSVRADERARLRAEIGQASQDALADAGNREIDALDAEAQAEQDALDQADA